MNTVAAAQMRSFQDARAAVTSHTAPAKPDQPRYQQKHGAKQRDGGDVSWNDSQCEKLAVAVGAELAAIIEIEVSLAIRVKRRLDAGAIVLSLQVGEGPRVAEPVARLRKMSVLVECTQVPQRVVVQTRHLTMHNGCASLIVVRCRRYV